ncbi:MAG: phage capsid protein [Oscillospiraceae bacterium]|nr:phage capsid protein [Oscillospiraceae bacterium]
MSICNFIPQVWSASLLQELDREYIGVKNSNRDFEGDIRKFGDAVHVNALGEIDVFAYHKDTNMDEPQTLDSSKRTIHIDQVKAFNFQLDDVDRAQSVPNIMQGAMRQAANALANTADQFLFQRIGEHAIGFGNQIEVNNFNVDNAVDTILRVKRHLLTRGVNTNHDTVLEVSPAVAAVILKAKILQTSDNVAAISNGYIGDFLGFRVYVSNNIALNANTSADMCIARTTRAVAFAEQLHEIEAYRPELRFADAVKGLHMYGAEIVYPNEIMNVSLLTN